MGDSNTRNLLLTSSLLCGFPGGSDGKESACNVGDLGSTPGSRRCPEGGHEPTPVFLPGESHGPKSLVDYSPQGHKESDIMERLTLSSVYLVKVTRMHADTRTLCIKSIAAPSDPGMVK